ncbi:MAG: type I secretion system permease/ATPase [Pseudomonadota bacterium]
MVNALRRLRRVFLGVGLFSGVINVLALTGSFYMLQVYDRILPSQSVPTLIAMTGLLIGLYLIYGVLDMVRLRVMSRVGKRIDGEVTERVFSALPQLQLKTRQVGDGLQPMRDLDQIRGFLSSIGPTALFDLPWLPVFLFVVFLLHPWLGIFATVAALLLVITTAYTEVSSLEPSTRVSASGAERFGLAQAAKRNAEAIQAMGFQDNLNTRWRQLNEQHTTAQLEASDIVGGMGSLTRVIRFCAQSGILGLGAYLVIQGEVSPGTIIAASITMSRALAPIETAIAHWRGFVAARQSYGRLTDIFAHLLPNSDADEGMHLSLPAPKERLDIEQLTVAPPGETKPTLLNVEFALNAGDGLGIIGASGAGKSTLARALVGVWRPLTPHGGVRLDGAELDQFTAKQLGRHIGYMPQEIALFQGTIAENISRFDPDATSENVIAASVAAGCHDMVKHLSGGYGTVIGDNGHGLSVGQRQRIALARALYNNPFLVVLDEPNANLDAEGEVSLTSAIKSVRARGGIAIVIAHRPSAIAAVDKVLAMQGGRVKAFGPKEDVLKSVLKAAPSPTDAPPAKKSTTPPVLDPLEPRKPMGKGGQRPRTDRSPGGKSSA